MKNFIIILLIILSALCSAQTVKVVDEKTNSPLQFVIITNTKNQSAITNKIGEASINAFGKSDILLFQLTGYEKKTISYQNLSADNFTVHLEEKSYTLGEVLVNGRRPNSEDHKTIGKGDILGYKDFKRSNDMYLDNALNLVPGVKMEVRSSTSQSHILIRGIGGKSRFSMRDVKVYYDGIPLTDADGTTSINDIDFTSIGKTEIVKGSSSGLYGSSIGGVVNLFSKRARFQEKDFNQIILFGSDGLLRSTTNFRAGTEKINFFANYSYQNYDGFREHSHSKKQFVTFGGDFFVSNSQTISLLVNYNRTNDEFSGEIDSVDFINNPGIANQTYIDKKIGTTSNSLLLGVSQIYKIFSNFENTSSIFMGQSFLETPIEPFFNRLNLNKVGARSVFSYDTEIGMTPVKLAFGGEIIRNFNVEKHYRISSDGIAGEINTDRELDLKQINLFAQAVIDFSPQTSLTFSTGLSWSDYETKDNLKSNGVDFSGERTLGAYLTPGISLTHSLNNNISLYAQINTGFSPPTVSEISISNGNINTNLNPERSINYEVGSSGKVFSDQLNYELSIFYLRLKDSFIPQPQGGFTTFVNAGSSENKGVEALLSYNLYKNKNSFINLIRPFITYSYNNFTFKDYKVGTNDYSGNEIPGIAPNLFNAGLDITTSYGFYFYATYNFVGKRFLRDDNSVSNKSYSLLGAKIGFRRRIEKTFTLQFYAGVDNLTDEKYSPIVAVNQRSQSQRGLSTYFNPAPLRNFYGAINFEYHF